MLVSFSYCDNIIRFFFSFNLCKYLRIYGLKVVNITNCLILILTIGRLIVTIISISIIVLLLFLLLLVLVVSISKIVFYRDHIIVFFFNWVNIFEYIV